MVRYAARKILLSVPLVLGVITLVFVLVELAPGSPIDRFLSPDLSPEVRTNLIAHYGLDQPIFTRYLRLLSQLARLDFGVSISHGEPVVHMILEALPYTLLLSGITLAAMFPAGIALGVVQAVWRGKPVDTGISVVSLSFYSMPGFWLALMLQLLLAYLLSEWLGQALPAWTGLPCRELSGMVESWCVAFPLDGAESTMAFAWPRWQLIPPSWLDPFMVLIYGPDHPATLANEAAHWNPWAPKRMVDLLWHLILPGIAMGLAGAAGTARYMRSAMVEVLGEDYIRTARAKGLAEHVVVLKHALRNALLPVLTLLGLSLPFLFSGSVLVEMIFSWPGMGRLIVEAIFAQDTPVLIACFLVFSVLVVLGNLVADLLYAVVDPRVSYD